MGSYPKSPRWPGPLPGVMPGASAAAGAGGGMAAEAASALRALGYKPAEVSRMVREAAEPGMSAEEIIRRALQGMASA